MARVHLPDPDSSLISSLRDAAEARIWLANQSQVQPLRLLRALIKELRAIDHCVNDALVRLELLDVLRPSLIEAQATALIRYAHKPLPLLKDEQEAFELARDLWHALAIAYLRVLPLLAPGIMLQALYRAASAMRQVLNCHFVSGIEVPPDHSRLLYELLVTAESQGLQRIELIDPDYPHQGQTTIAGDLAWSFLLLFSDPYRFSSAQLAVLNRAFGRWGGLASFQAEPSTERRPKTISLLPWLGGAEIGEGQPRWLDIRPVVRKIRHRIESLQAGESPEKLKLGRELSTTACIQLMRDLDDVLRPNPAASGDFIDAATVDLVFGHEHLYWLLAGKPLAESKLTVKSDSISYDRLAVFGFDNAVNRIDHAGDTRVPAETWTVEDGWILRAAPAGCQVIAPLLVGVRPNKEEKAQLMVLTGLRQTSEGWLAAHVKRLPTPAQTAIVSVPALPGTQTRMPVFLVPKEGAEGLQPTICLPAGSGLRQGSLLALEGSSTTLHIRLCEIVARGSNFVRFTYTGA